jgi:hypothetical protein
METRHGNTCKVQQSGTSRSVEAEVYEFKENARLIVVLNKSVKLNMVWNGKLYEGKMAGLDFTSAGPEIKKYTTSARG